VSAEYLAKYGASVINNGYLIVPIVKGSKAPGLAYPAKKWSTIVSSPAKLEEWVGKGFGGNGIGILSSVSPGVDMDCQDESLVKQLREFVIDRLGDTIERVGLAPKTLLVYRADIQFPKVNSATFIDSMGRTAKLEVLGDGQQFVALHVHPDTKRPYKWVEKGGLKKGPHNTHRNTLPEITREDAEAIRDEFERLCRERGWPEKKTLKRLGSSGEINRDDPFIHDAAKVTDLSDAEIRGKLLAVPNSDEYETWLQIGMALYHQYDGGQEGLDLWHEWSATATNYDDKALDAKWGSFDIEGKKRPPMTARLILRLAGDEEQRIATEALAEAKEQIALTTTLNDLEKEASKLKHIAFTRPVREMLAGIVKAQFKKITGTMPPISVCREMVRYQDPQSGSEVPPWLVGYVYVQLDETFYNYKSRQSLSTKGFDQSYSRFMLSRAEMLEGKATPETLPSHMALNVFRIPTVANRMYMPGEDDLFTINGTPYVNFYSTDGLPEVAETISSSGMRCIERMEAHVRHLFRSVRDGDLLLDWIAYIVQTGQRVNWAPVIQGIQGDGKTWFSELLKAILGMNNVIVIKGKALEEQYNAWAEGHQIVFIEEVRLHGKNRFDAVNSLKTNITNTTVEIRRMRTDIYNVINQSSYFITSNSRDGLPIDATDTRYFPMFSRYQRKVDIQAFNAANPDYYTDLYQSLNEPGVLRKYFMERVLSEEFSATARAPVSASRSQMIELGKSEEIDAFEVALQEEPAMDFCDAMLDSALCGSKMTGHGSSAPLGLALNRMLDGAGFTTLGRVKVNGDSRRLWSRTPERFTTEDGLVDKEAIRAYFDNKEPDLTGL
jgi:hypothetical protein